MKKTFSFALAIALLVTACKKDDASSAVTKENLVGSYKVTALTYSTAGSGTIDAYATLLPACQKDDITQLNADMTYVLVDAGTKCTPTGGANGTWSLPSATQIVLNGTTYTIQSFDGRTLVGTNNITSSGVTYTVTATFVKQ